jgi:DNA-binding XRE family transcriptional regulator
LLLFDTGPSLPRKAYHPLLFSTSHLQIDPLRAISGNFSHQSEISLKISSNFGENRIYYSKVYFSWESVCMTLTQLRESVPMGIPELARAAGVDDQTIRNAENGQRINIRTARAIAQALSEALGRTIQVQEIEGLQVRW